MAEQISYMTNYGSFHITNRLHQAGDSAAMTLGTGDIADRQLALRAPPAIRQGL